MTHATGNDPAGDTADTNPAAATTPAAGDTPARDTADTNPAAATTVAGDTADTNPAAATTVAGDTPARDTADTNPAAATTPAATTPADTNPATANRLARWGLAAAVITAVLLTVSVSQGWAVVSRFDEALTSFTRSWADPLGWPVDVAHAIGSATAPRWSMLAAVVLVVVLLLARYRAAAGMLAVSAVLGVALTELGKLAVGRQRPPGAGAFEPDLDQSFPSGHSSAGIYLFLATGVILLQLSRVRGGRLLAAAGWALVLFGPLLGLTRLVLGVHWPTDILAGWAFGSIGLLTSAVLLWSAVDAGWGHVAGSAPPAAGSAGG